MTHKVSSQTDRLVALDKIRYSMVVAVLILHSACAYAGIIPWWSVRESATNPFFDLLIIFLDLFLMPVLYFLAGFFALSSLEKRGSVRFMAAKLSRLGVPSLLVGIFFVPVISFIGYQSRNADPAGYWQFWWMQMRTVFDWHWVHYTSIEAAKQYANDFSLWHLWFISLLLIFFILTASFYRLFPRWFQRKTLTSSAGTRSILLGLLAAGIAGALLMGLVQRISPDWCWAKIGGFIMIQPTRVPIYIALFALGIWANTHNWFTAGQFPASPWLWLGTGLLSFVGILGALQSIMQPAPIPWSVAFLHGGLRSFAGLAFLCFFLSGGQRWGYRPTAIWRSMHPVSYELYLIHLPVVVILQLVALHLSIPNGLKFVLVCATALTVCWSLARFVIKPHVALAVLLLFGSFGLSALLIQ